MEQPPEYHSHEPVEFALLVPHMPYDPVDFELDPDPAGQDAWLLKSSQGDVVLLALLLAKERLGVAHTEGLTDETYMDRMMDLGRKITIRQEQLGSS